MDPLTIISTALPPAMSTQAYSVQLQALGGVPPYSWAIVGGFGTPPTGVSLVADTLVAVLGAIPESQIGAHPFRVRVTDSTPTSVVADVGIEVRPYGFTRAHDFLLDPQVFEMIQKYLVGGATREKVETHFFRDIVTALGDNFVHLDRDILVPGWTGIYPFTAPVDTDLRSALADFQNDLLYFANPMKWLVSSVVPGPGLHQATVVITSSKALFIGRNGETDAAMARLWFKLVDPDSDDEPHDGDGNPLTLVTLTDAAGVEIDPNAKPYMSDTSGFHTGKNGVGTDIGFDLTLVVEYVPNPNNKNPILPFAVRYGMREELHDISPEAFLKFANIVGDIDADVIKLIKNAPFVGNIRVDNKLVKPINQIIEMVGQNGVNIEAEEISGRILVVAPDSVRTINGVPPAGAGDLEIKDGEFIEIETEVDDKHLTIKTIIPVQQIGQIAPKGLVSAEDYAKILEMVSRHLTHLHKHYGEDLTIGTPPDGSFQDGFIPLDPRMTLAEALDRLNEALGTALGPTVAPLDDMDLVEFSGIARERGVLADDPGGVGGITYGPDPAGIEVSYCYDFAPNFPATPFVVETAGEFGDVSAMAGDVLDVYLNGILLETWAPAAIAVGPSPGGFMNISSVRALGPSTLIKLQAVVPPSDPNLLRGYNTIMLRHITAGPVSHDSALYGVFLDATVPSAGGVGLPATITVSCPGRKTWVSGIEHYAGDNETLIDFSALNAYRDFYYSDPYSVEVNSPAGWQPPKMVTTADLPGTSVPPAWNDTVAPAALSTGEAVKDLSVAQLVPSAYLRLNLHRPGGTFTYAEMGPILTAAGDVLLYDLGVARSTDLVEAFEDEKYRLNPYDVRWGGYKYIPQMVRGNYGWDSTKTLFAGTTPWGDSGGDPGALQINPHVKHAGGLDEDESGSLTWPVLNYNIGAYDPAQPVQRDYGVQFALTQVAIFDRPFVFKDTPRNNGTFRIYGVTSADLGLSYLGSGGAPAGNVNLEIKFPGSKTNYFSGWMDLDKLGSGTFNDGDGARVGMVRDFAPPNKETYIEIDWTGNGLSTEDSGEMIILRVTFRNTGVRIYKIEEVG